MAPYYMYAYDVCLCINRPKLNGMFDYSLLSFFNSGVDCCISSYVLFINKDQINVVDWQNQTMVIINKSGVEKFHKRLFKGYKTI